MDENTNGFYTSQISTANSPGWVLLFKKRQRKYYNQLERDSGYLISQPCYIMTMEENLKISKWEHFVSHTTQILFMVHHEHRKPRVWWRETTELWKKISPVSSKKKRLIKQNGAVIFYFNDSERLRRERNLYQGGERRSRIRRGVVWGSEYRHQPWCRPLKRQGYFTEFWFNYFKLICLLLLSEAHRSRDWWQTTLKQNWIDFTRHWTLLKEIK